MQRTSIAVAAILFGCAAQAGLKSDAIRQALTEQIEKHEISGAVGLVATREGVSSLEAVGSADPAGTRRMATDSIFWIASMTKPTTATAVMMMNEQGKLSIEDPVSKYIPELASLKLADGTPAQVTLRHMLTHTSGMGEPTNEEAARAKTLAELIPAIATKPLLFKPGAQWKYCQSGINTLARVVEIVSGEPYPEFVQKHLFGPLKMKDTAFYLTDAQLPRLVTPVKRDGETLVPATIGLLHGLSPTSHDRYPAANGGLFSTAPDYARFARMILNDGMLDGKRYLSASSVHTMTTLQTGDLKTGFTPGNGWGLGWCIVREPQGVTATLSPGTFGHGGAYGTQAWIDRQKGVALILMVQRADFKNADDTGVRLAFQEAAAGK